MIVEKNVPEIRFKGFSGEWVSCSIGNITIFHKQGFYTTENYAPSKKYYLLRGTDLNNNKLVLNGTPKINATEKDYKDFKVEIGDVLLVRSGNVGTYGIVYENIEGIFGSYLINFRFDNSKIVNEFFGCFYQSELFFKQLRQIIQQSANTNINAENIKSIDIGLTNLKEQTAIGNTFQKLDSLINQHQQKHDKLSNIKKAMLEKMFPKQCETTPEIRFKGFSGEWEEKRVSQLGDVVTGSTPSTQVVTNYSDDGVPWVTPTDISKNFTFTSAKKLSDSGCKAARIVPKNTILVTCIASIGKNTILGIQGSFNQQINGVIPNEKDNAPYFLFTASILWSEKLKRSAASGTMQIVNKTEFSELKTFVPNKEEQTAIGNYFQKLDSLINQHQQQITKLTNIKQACLSKMFV